MIDLLTTISKYSLSFLNNEIYLNLIGVIFTAVLSYNAAKYSASKPNKTNIKQQQFNKVYLPLYRLIVSSPKTPTRLQAIQLQKKIANKKRNSLFHGSMYSPSSFCGFLLPLN